MKGFRLATLIWVIALLAGFCFLFDHPVYAAMFGRSPYKLSFCSGFGKTAALQFQKSAAYANGF